MAAGDLSAVFGPLVASLGYWEEDILQMQFTRHKYTEFHCWVTMGAWAMYQDYFQKQMQGVKFLLFPPFSGFPPFFLLFGQNVLLVLLFLVH